MNTNKLKDFISWLIQISFEGYSKEKQIERLMALCVDMQINHEAFKTLVKAVNDCSVFETSAIEELAKNIEKWTKVYTQRYLSRMISDVILDQHRNGKAEKFINIWTEADTSACRDLNLVQTAYSNMWLRQKFIRWLIGNGYGIVELRDLRYIDIVANSLALNSHRGAYQDHPLIDIDSYSVNHGSRHKGADILQWIEKYPKCDFDRNQKAIEDWAGGLRILPKDKAPFIVDSIGDNLRYPEKLPNASVSGSFISRDTIKAKQRELDQKSQAWLFNPKHHEPIGSRQMRLYNDRVSDSWAGMVKATRDLWIAIRENFYDPNPKAYLKKNQRGKPVVAKKKHKPSSLLKALVAKKD